MSVGKKSKSSLLEQIRDKVVQIDQVLKRTLATQRNAAKDDRKQQENVKRGEQEKTLEKVDKKDNDKKVKGLKPLQ